MIKKIIFVLFCFIMIFSCGKKGDPQYKESLNINNSAKMG